MRSFALALLGLLVAGAAWQALAATLERQRVAPRGILADAGGHRLHLVQTGRGQAGPTVLLETGIGGATAGSWAWVQRGVEGFAPVVSYDRAGLGASDPGPLPRDGTRIAGELHAALASAGISGPYVFVGHSFGGLIARIFTQAYPDEVAGVVLVESSYAGTPRAGRGSRRIFGFVRTLLPVAPWAARLGIVRAILAVVRTDADRLPPGERAQQRAYLASARLWIGVRHEWDSWASRTAPEAARVRSLGSRPLAIYTAGGSARTFDGWAAAQHNLLALSTDSVHRTVEGATHGSILADSAHAARVTQGIHEVVRAVREHRLLREIALEDSTARPGSLAE